MGQLSLPVAMGNAPRRIDGEHEFTANRRTAVFVINRTGFEAKHIAN